MFDVQLARYCNINKIVRGELLVGDMNWLVDYAKSADISSVVELGVMRGLSSNLINYTLQHKGKPFSHYCVDIFSIRKNWRIPADPVTNPMVKKEEIKAEFLHSMTGLPYNLIEFDSTAAANLFENDSIDWIFIDADHTYPKVKEDILAWLPKIRSGGCICGHDYRTYEWGVKRAVDEIFGGDAKLVGNCSIWYVI